MPNTSAVAQHSDQYISSFDVDIHKPEKRNQLFRQYGHQGMPYFQILETLGNTMKSSQTKYSHFEEDWIVDTLVPATTVPAGAAGAAITIPIDPNTIDSSGKAFVRANDSVMFLNQVVGHVVSVTGTAPNLVATIVPHGATDVLGPVAAGQDLIVYSNSHAEGTGGPEGRVGKALEFSFEHQILKEKNVVTGTELTNATWMETDSDGRSVNAWYLKGQHDMDYRFALAMDGAALFNKPIDNPSLTGSGIRAMTGLIPWIEAGGNVGYYTPGLLTLSDFDAMTRKLDKGFAPEEHLGLLGINLYQDIENLFMDSFESNPKIFANGSQKGQEINLAIKQLKKTGRKYNFKKMDIFNHPKLYGAAGFDINGLGAWIPIGTTKDAKTKTSLPYVGMKYKFLNGNSRRIETFFTGGGTGIRNKTSDVDIHEMNMRAEIGTEYCAVKSFYLWKTL